MPSRRLSADCGIAIGPLLFVVAILGLLVTAIAAGSGSFSSSSNNEAARTKAAALLQIGQILKAGVERLAGLGVDIDTINIDPTSTSNTNDLFAPAGGGVNAPAVTLANSPVNDVWYYPLAAIPGLGSSNTERLAMLKVALDICNELNLRANAISTAANDSSMTNDIGDVTTATLAGAVNWPTPLQGQNSGCLHNSNSTTSGYFFYQVLGMR